MARDFLYLYFSAWGSSHTLMQEKWGTEHWDSWPRPHCRPWRNHGTLWLHILSHTVELAGPWWNLMDELPECLRLKKELTRQHTARLSTWQEALGICTHNQDLCDLKRIKFGVLKQAETYHPSILRHLLRALGFWLRVLAMGTCKVILEIIGSHRWIQHVFPILMHPSAMKLEKVGYEQGHATQWSKYTWQNQPSWLHVCGTYNGGAVPRLLWGIAEYLYFWYLNFLVGLLLHVVMMHCN